jgi:hypothetical protein
VLQASEDVALERKSGGEVPGKGIAQRQLERYLSLKVAIGTPSEPHLSHSPCAEPAEQDVRSDVLPGHRTPEPDRGRSTDRVVACHLVLCAQELPDGAGDRRVLAR